MLRSKFTVSLAGLAAAICALGQSPERNAREIFFDEPAPGANVQQTQKPVPGKPQSKIRKKTVPPPAPGGTEQAEVVPVKLASATAPKPLGLRVSLLKLTRDNQPVEISPDTELRAKDRVRLNIQVSDSGYLYIVNRGSSGLWTQLFPSPDLPNASNVVSRGAEYSIPSDRGIVVENPPGADKLFVILSRQPGLDIESIKHRDDQPKSENNLQKTYAVNLPPLDDAAINRLRDAYSRDLVIEKVDPTTPGSRRENAIYVVNPAGGDDSRVVLDFDLKHQ